MKILFYVEVDGDNFEKGQTYPVFSIRDFSEKYEERFLHMQTDFLIYNKKGNFIWVEMSNCKFNPPSDDGKKERRSDGRN